jgi:hypothetical protein
VSKRGRASDKSVTVIYDDPPFPAGYGGSFGGTWTTGLTNETWTFTGHIEMVYDGDSPTPPPGGPPGTYRMYKLTTASASVSATIEPPTGCGFAGSGPVQIDAADFASAGRLMVQDSPTPAYFIGFMSTGKTIPLTKTGSPPDCTDAGAVVQYPAPGVWAQMETSQTSASQTLVGTATIATPVDYDYDYTTNWNLAPRN